MENFPNYHNTPEGFQDLPEGITPLPKTTPGYHHGYKKRNRRAPHCSEKDFSCGKKPEPQISDYDYDDCDYYPQEQSFNQSPAPTPEIPPAQSSEEVLDYYDRRRMEEMQEHPDDDPTLYSQATAELTEAEKYSEEYLNTLHQQENERQAAKQARADIAEIFATGQASVSPAVAFAPDSVGHVNRGRQEHCLPKEYYPDKQTEPSPQCGADKFDDPWT